MVQTFEDVRAVANALGWGCEYSQTLGDDICVDIYRDSPAGCELYFAYDVKSPEDMAAEVRADADWGAEAPVFEISAGHLLQVLVGYHSFAEIRNELKIFDEEKYKELDAFLPKQKCYIIDEY